MACPSCFFRMPDHRLSPCIPSIYIPSIHGHSLMLNCSGISNSGISDSGILPLESALLQVRLLDLHDVGFFVFQHRVDFGDESIG